MSQLKILNLVKNLRLYPDHPWKLRALAHNVRSGTVMASLNYGQSQAKGILTALGVCCVSVQFMLHFVVSQAKLDEPRPAGRARKAIKHAGGDRSGPVHSVGRIIHHEREV